MEIDLKHLEYFVAAAEYPSFRRAAAGLNVRQSVLSRRIRALEDEIGVSLFQRDKSGATLTVAGHRFLARAKSSLADLEEMVKAARDAGRGMTGRLRIGAMSTFAPGFLHDLIRGFADHHPDVEMEFTQEGPRVLTAQIRDQRIDVAILTGRQRAEPNCDVLQLWCEQVFVALPENHPLAGRTAVEWSALRDERLLVPRGSPGPEIHQVVIRHVSQDGEEPALVQHAVDPEALMNIVGLGFGVTLTCETSASVTYPGVVFRPIRGPEDLLPYRAIWLPENDNPALRRFLSQARMMIRRTAAQPDHVA